MSILQDLSACDMDKSCMEFGEESGEYWKLEMVLHDERF